MRPNHCLLEPPTIATQSKASSARAPLQTPSAGLIEDEFHTTSCAMHLSEREQPVRIALSKAAVHGPLGCWEAKLHVRASSGTKAARISAPLTSLSNAVADFLSPQIGAKRLHKAPTDRFAREMRRPRGTPAAGRRLAPSWPPSWPPAKMATRGQSSRAWTSSS